MAMCERKLAEGVTLKNPLILGPMAGVTDHPFRLICHELGAALTGTEMVSANALKYGNKKTLDFVDVREDERPVSLQLFGPDPEAFAAAIGKLEGRHYDILDINMGCPMPKIVKNGEGSALMQNPALAGAIVRECVRRAPCPVTVKLRAGFSPGERTAVELAKRVEAEGASAVAVHGRTREQYYTGRADWSIIREVKAAVGIPVIGNGDVTSGEKALQLMQETGCDFVMIARGARGNPWIFREALAYLAGGETGISGTKKAGAGEEALPGRPTWDEIAALLLRHLRMQIEEKGEHLGICQMRKHIAWYTGGLPGSSALRAAVNQADSYAAMRALLVDYFTVPDQSSCAGNRPG